MAGFTPFEREEISPVLTPVFMEVLLNALVDVDYVEMRDGGASRDRQEAAEQARNRVGAGRPGTR